MASMTIALKVSVAWWVTVYIKMLTLFCQVTGEIPDLDKVAKVCMKGISVKHKRSL
jgi:hypothetical protein